MSGDEFAGGGGGALLGAAFLFDVLGAVGDFIIEGFDFSGEVKILRVFGVGGEERIPLGFQFVAFLFPDTGSSNHGFNLGTSVRLFMVCG
jgi:hypothetical protein